MRKSHTDEVITSSCPVTCTPRSAPLVTPRATVDGATPIADAACSTVSSRPAVTARAA